MADPAAASASEPSDDATRRVVHARRPTPEERAAQLLAFERETEREERWDMARTLLWCFFWSLLGIFLLGFSMHTTDMRYAVAAFWGGMAVGNTGILLTLGGAWRRAEDR